VYEGGVVHLPEDISFGRQNVLGYPSGLNVACLGETIALAMEGATRSYSLGNRIDYAEAVGIYEAALRHGFRPHIPQGAARANGAMAAARSEEEVLVPDVLRPAPGGELGAKAVV
jgi:hypothetical protein